MAYTISSSIASAVSGLKAQETKLANAADNIANLSSRNYAPKDTVMISEGASVRAQTISGEVGAAVQLDQEIISTVQSEHAYKAAVEALKIASKMHEVLLKAYLPDA